MTALTDAALLARRDRLVTALHDQLRDKLSLAEITTAVDQAIDTVGLPALLDTIVAAQALAEAVAADVPTPPASVTAAVGGYTPKAGGVNEDYNIFDP